MMNVINCQNVYTDAYICKRKRSLTCTCFFCVYKDLSDKDLNLDYIQPSKKIVKKEHNFSLRKSSIFDLIPDEILLNILEFTQDNNTAHSLANTCKYINNLFNNHGYLKYLHVKPYLCLGNFLNMNVKHISTLSSISFSHKHNPHLWICGNWVKKVNFFNCTFSNHYINPSCSTDTEELYIICFRCDKYIIDFSKFPKLKKLYINCFDVKFQNIEHCKELVEANIQIRFGGEVKIPKFINDITRKSI